MESTHTLSAASTSQIRSKNPVNVTFDWENVRVTHCAFIFCLKGTVSSSFMEHFISRQTTTNLWLFSTSGTGNALNYINLMHQIRRIITVAHVCRRVLLDVRGIVRVLEVLAL